MPENQTNKSGVPVYQLYGEDQHWLTPDLLHCESIAARSLLHNWEIKPHRHHGLFQLLWLEQGVASLQLDDWQGQLDAGSILIVPQHCVHGFQFSPDAQGLVITLAYPFFDRLAAGLGAEFIAYPGPHVFALGEILERMLLEHMLHKLAQEYRGQSQHRLSLIESLLTAILVLLNREMQGYVALKLETPIRARQYLALFAEAIEADFSTHQPLDYYAAKVGISAAHLNAVCRQLAQQTALDLIHARITLEAKRSLVYTSMTIRAVSDVLGFSDPAYFTRFFKRQTGMAPKKFRQQLAMLSED
jgi:AraC family transcriptional activator of pobA